MKASCLKNKTKHQYLVWCSWTCSVHHRAKSLKWNWSDFSHTHASFVNILLCLSKCLIGDSVKERQSENSCLSKLFHRTHAWANSLFLEVDGVFCELFPNLRNGDRQPAKRTRGENKIKLVLSLLPLQQTFLFTSCFKMFLFVLFFCVKTRGWTETGA